LRRQKGVNCRRSQPSQCDRKNNLEVGGLRENWE
jgi:hypothetical protein